MAELTSPLDITTWFVGQLRANGLVAKAKGKMTLAQSLGTLGGLVAHEAEKLKWFKRQVQSRGPWDFKANYLKDARTAGVIFAGAQYRNDMPGNFHYGFVGAAAGFSETVLELGAGQAQLRSNTSKPEYWCTAFDDPEDNAYVKLGIALYNAKGVSVTVADVDAYLKKFKLTSCGKPGWMTQQVIEQLFPAGK
ncbi:MAG: polymorphic toxin type 44 domain-containing protein [Pirellulales bacterium]